MRQERDILKKATVGSTGQRNMIDDMMRLEDPQRRVLDDQDYLLSRNRNFGGNGRAVNRSVRLHVFLDKHAGSIFGVLRAKGGFAPFERRRSIRSLTMVERQEISCGLNAGLSLRTIALQIGRAPSSVCREVARNGGRKRYRATNADAMAWQRATRPKLCALAMNDNLCSIVISKLQNRWSPQQISGWLAAQYGDDRKMRVSHETIYKSLFIQARGVLKKELMAHLRSRRVMRRAKKSTTQGQPRGQIIDAISIRDRPAEVEDRAIPGHWEGDLLSGSKNSHIATLVERQTRYVMLVHVAGKDTANVVGALVRQVQRLPSGLMDTLTWDRGMELAHHKQFSIATNVDVYFCDPQSPGRVAATRTPMACCANISQKEPTYRNTASATLTLLLFNSAHDRVKPLATRLQLICWRKLLR